MCYLHAIADGDGEKVRRVRDYVNEGGKIIGGYKEKVEWKVVGEEEVRRVLGLKEVV